MLRLQVLVNGRLLCTAGRREGDSLHALVSLHPPADAHIWEAGAGRIAKVRGECALEVVTETSNEALSWAELELEPGDEVVIRILGSGEYDPPMIKRSYEF